MAKAKRPGGYYIGTDGKAHDANGNEIELIKESTDPETPSIEVDDPVAVDRGDSDQDDLTPVLEGHTVKELRQIAKNLDIETKGLRKAELIDAIVAAS